MSLDTGILTIKARVTLEIMMMSREQKSTKKGEMNGGWKMPTAWGSEFGLFGENEGEEIGGSPGRRGHHHGQHSLRAVGEQLSLNKSLQETVSSGKMQGPMRPGRQGLLQEAVAQTADFAADGSQAAEGTVRVSRGGKGWVGGRDGATRRLWECLGLLVMTGIARDKVHKTLF